MGKPTLLPQELVNDAIVLRNRHCLKPWEALISCQKGTLVQAFGGCGMGLGGSTGKKAECDDAFKTIGRGFRSKVRSDGLGLPGIQTCILKALDEGALALLGSRPLKSTMADITNPVKWERLAKAHRWQKQAPWADLEGI